MTAAIIGISSGLLIIFLFVILKRFDKKIIYGLILCRIGFLYVGYAWMDLQALVINSIQAWRLGYGLPFISEFKPDSAAL